MSEQSIGSSVEQTYIPLDKSWHMRLGVLDLINNHDDTLVFLGQQDTLSDDLIALEEASEAWPSDELIPVGESGTLYRFLSFVSWKFGLDKEFATNGTLTDREITRDPRIVNLSQRELLELDNGTSQWASAAALTGDEERLDQPPYKLALTYEAIGHWQQARRQGGPWQPRRDETIARQAAVFQSLVRRQDIKFKPVQSEDFCFAVVLTGLKPENGATLWPSLAGHESNRIEEIVLATEQANSGEIVTSRDHRVVQAIAMRSRLVGLEVEFEHPGAVSKSWPKFWSFLETVAS